MKWWLWLWLGALTWLTIGGAWDDIRNGRRAVSIGLGVIAGVSCIVSVLAFAKEPFAASLGKWLLPLSIGAGLQILVDAVREVRALSPDADLTMRENRVIKVGGAAAVGVVFGAAVVVGVLTGAQRW